MKFTTTRSMIDKRIQELEEDLKSLTPGTEEYERVEKSISELLKTRMQIDACLTNRFAQIGATIFSVSLPLYVYSKLWDRGLKFEESGYVSSTSVKNLFQRFKFF